MSVTLSEPAAQRLAKLSDTAGRPRLLRVAVDGGGCSGFQYRFELIDGAEADDVVIERDGQRAVVDPVSLPFLVGSQIDFADELVGARFVVNNPNAQASCGCGVSFTI
ncbi:iron-sulfur cluster insertion protein ErpA [Brevundimonas sp. 2R-24]|uniref:Iron-sulfur cluster insertion protein ErpA n=1 Tax=Peiella sedimenti TaxID=3061083 RepID=A0ABT8SK94_9CAUL|nr:iron-sulfur cluster insertion protein ErpA [Caulobacteraceae bacterium XZ-24]